MNTELVKRILSSIIIIPLVFYFLINGSFFLVFFLIICFIIAFYEWIKISKKTSYKIFGFIFLSFSFFTFYDLSIELFPLIFVILISISTDVGGYVFGKIFKGPKLTRISPNKTYAGMVGGYLLSLACLLIITNFIDYKMTPFRLFLITILLSTISQIGDIIISYFKRLSKIKDSGKLIPGHGGILDRIDGMIFAFPFYYIFNLIINIK